VFLGYGLDGVGYRLYDPVLKKLIRCCEAEFIKDQGLKDIEDQGPSSSGGHIFILEKEKKNVCAVIGFFVPRICV